MAWGVFFGVLSGPVNGGPTAGPSLCAVSCLPLCNGVIHNYSGNSRSHNRANGSRERLVDRSVRRARVAIARLRSGKEFGSKAARGSESLGRGGGTRSYIQG